MTPEPRTTPSPAPAGLLRQVAITLDMIKFAHTIFALPFALLAAVAAAGGWPEARVLGWIVAACVFARSSAMAFNRLMDAPFDEHNPRTKGWALPSGLLSRKFVLVFCVASAAGFVVSAGMLNRLALWLSPVCLAVLLGYSLCKRFTRATHFVLGLALGIAPIGAWIGVRGSLDWPPVLLGLGVLLWVAGFDIIYSCQDAEFDRAAGLHSLPSRAGKRRALAISALSHAACVVVFAAAGWALGLGAFYLAAVGATGWLLAYEQSIISPGDLSRLGRAFFTLNGWVSVMMFLGGLCDILMGK